MYEVSTPEDVESLRTQGVLTAERCPPTGHRAIGGPDASPFPTRAPGLPLAPPTPREIAQVDGAVLVAQMAGPGRWSQAAFPKWLIDNFFEVQPHSAEKLTLWPIRWSGKVGASEERACGSKGSDNWYYELGLARDLDWPANGKRPIGLFHRRGRQEFDYMIVMPHDDDYGTIASFLKAAEKIPSGTLPRAIVTSAALNAAWPEAPLFKT